MRHFLSVSGLSLASALLVSAHDGKPLAPHDVWTAWPSDPLVIGGLAASAALYFAGTRKRRGIATWEMTCYWCGWLLLFVALASPLHPMGEVLFSAHMLQHELIMIAAAPLVVLGRPLTPFARAGPQALRFAVGTRMGLPIWRFVIRPIHAWWIHFVVLWGWHVPILFVGSVQNVAVHAVQHTSFLASGLIFWWAVSRRLDSQQNRGTALIFIFSTMMHTGILGALLTFSPRPWYPVYALTTRGWGLSPLEDQQLGGLIMLVPPMAIYLVVFLWVFGKWMGIHHTSGPATAIADLSKSPLRPEATATPPQRS